MTQKITPTLMLYDSTLTRITAEAARRGVDPADIMSELLTIGAAALGEGAAAPPAQTEPAFYTPSDVARILNLRPATITDYCRTGKICATRAGNRWRITPGALANFIGTEKKSV